MVVQKENKQSAAGDFKELKLIGEGSYGRVYRAIRRSDNREYETALSPRDVDALQPSKGPTRDEHWHIRVLSCYRLRSVFPAKC